MRRPLTAVAAVLLALVVVAGLVAPLLGYDPVADVDPSRANLAPRAWHWLGTDHLGRDIAWRLLLACHSFVGPGLLACVVAGLVGIPLGALAGFYGGSVATGVRYGFGVVSSLPQFVLILLAASIYGNSMLVLALVAGASFAPVLGEAVFARIEELRAAEYVVANRAYGLPGWRILWVHLVWAVSGRAILRHLLALFGAYLVLETTLSYIGGFGIQEPQPSWGNMLVFEWGRNGGNPYNVLAPAVALQATVTAIAWLTEAFQEPEDG